MFINLRTCVLHAVSATLILSELSGVAHTATDEAPSGEFEVLANVPYVTRGEQPLRMNLYIPEGDGPFPAVLLVHGGAWRMGNRWHMHSVGQKAVYAPGALQSCAEVLEKLELVRGPGW